MKKLQTGQVWELATDQVLVVLLINPSRNSNGEVYWRTLVLHDTLYPETIGTVTNWYEKELLDETPSGEGDFVRLT